MHLTTPTGVGTSRLVWPDRKRITSATVAQRDAWWSSHVHECGLVLPPLAHDLLMRYVAAAHADGQCRLQPARLADHLGVNRKSICRSDRWLADHGLVLFVRYPRFRVVTVIGWEGSATQPTEGSATHEEVNNYYLESLGEEELGKEVVADDEGGATHNSPRVALPSHDFTFTRQLLTDLDVDEDGQRRVCGAIASGTTSHQRVVEVHANLVKRGKARGHGGLAIDLVMHPAKGLARPTGPGGTIYRTPAEVNELRRQSRHRLAQIEMERRMSRNNEVSMARTVLERLGWKVPESRPVMRLVV